MATTSNTFSSSNRPLHYDQLMTRVLSVNWEVLAWSALLLLAFFTRFYELGIRVMSHDESLHTYYSWELYSQGRFAHTPLMHGPLLFHATAFFYFLFGPSDFSARIYTAILGVAIVMFPYLFRRWLGRSGAIAAGVGLLISPMLLYYSRYIRHDIPSIFFAMVMVYAIMQYVDGEKTRRPVWLAVLSGAMVLMLASKEVAFFYVAIFGSYLMFFWILRMLQDAMIFSHIGHEVDEEGDAALLIRYNTSPLWMLLVGHVATGIFSLILGYMAGAAFYVFYSAESGILPDDIPLVVFQLSFSIVIFLLFEAFGFIRTFLAGEPQAGMAGMVANSMKNMRSTLGLIMAGVFIGAACAVWIVSVIDMIGAENDPTTGQTGMIELTKETRILDDGTQETVITDIDIVATEFSRFFAWSFVPVAVVVFFVLLIAILRLAPLADVMGVLLIALMSVSILVYLERRTVPSIFELDNEVGGQTAVAIDPEAEGSGEEREQSNVPIFLTWIVCGIAVGGVVATRLLTNVWDFMNRQPIFDALIVMGSMIFPWLAAVPIFAAGYQLDAAPLPVDSVGASIITSIPFFLVSIAVGMAWNWRVWPMVAAVFTVLFLLFFTTFFTNGDGVGTGVIGSLGYWLEQQEVRRGSQPQYYYLWLQMPVYEFLPMILMGIAGFYGLDKLFKSRRESRNEELRAMRAYKAEHVEDMWMPERANPLVDEVGMSAQPEQAELVSEEAVVDDVLSANVEPAEMPEDEYVNESPSTTFWEEGNYAAALSTPRVPDWAQPYDHDVEMARRNSPSAMEYLGGVPFLQLVAYQALIMLTGLTFAGEKMPWLTTHITFPMILIGGWYIGRLIDNTSWQSVKRSGWLLLLVLLPIFMIALVEMTLPFVTGQEIPFQGDNQQRAELSATSEWLAAFLVVVVIGYFIVQNTVQVGLANVSRFAMLSFTMILALLTMRAAWMFSFINYDLATEYGVYAHAGPAVKDVLFDLNYIAERHPDGYNMHIAYDDKSTWPMLWYLRDFTNKRYLFGGADNVQNQVGDLEGAVVVIVGSDKRAEVARVLGDDYYEFDLIRLWWPMQDYFNLSYTGVNNALKPDSESPAASMLRDGVWNIWWSRDYDVYGEAKCIDDRVEQQCFLPAEEDAEPSLDTSCVQRVRNECSTDTTFNIERWPVSDGLYMFVDKEFAVTIWDAGLDGQTVNERLIPDPEDAVEQEINAVDSFGSGELNSPRDIEFGPDNLLYVTDTNNNRVVVYDPATRTIIRAIGPGEFNQPQGLAFDRERNYLYVADTWNFRVAVYTLEGEFVHSFGQDSRVNPVSDVGFFGPREIEVDAQGYIYVSDTGNHRIRVYDPDWNFVRDIEAQNRGLLGEPEPVGIKINPVSGQLYIAETWNQTISVFSRDGRGLNAWDVNMWVGSRSNGSRPYIAISPDGTLILVSDMDDNDDNNGPRIVAYNLAGQAVISFNAPFVPSEGQFSPLAVEVVAGIAIAPDGQIFVADSETNRIVVFPQLAVTGGILPVPDVTYTGELGATGDTSDGAVLEDDMSALRGIGFSYWQAQVNDDYELFFSLHCVEDQASVEMVSDPETFTRDSVQWSRYDGADFSQVNVVISLTDAETATIRYDGVLTLLNDGSEFPINISDHTSLNLIKRDGSWRICNSVANTSPDVFAPGGG